MFHETQTTNTLKSPPDTQIHVLYMQGTRPVHDHADYRYFTNEYRKIKLQAMECEIALATLPWGRNRYDIY